MRNLLLLVTIFMAVAWTTGCGNGKLATIKVTGKVTFDGVPLAGAMVNFSPKSSEGHPAYGTTDGEGNYTLQTFLGNADAGTTPGEYIVTITKTEGGEVSTGMPEGKSTSDSSAPPPPPKSVIPERYGSSAQSGLSATVSKENRVFDFDLTK